MPTGREDCETRKASWVFIAPVANLYLREAVKR